MSTKFTTRPGVRTLLEKREMKISVEQRHMVLDGERIRNYVIARKLLILLLVIDSRCHAVFDLEGQEIEPMLSVSHNVQ